MDSASGFVRLFFFTKLYRGQRYYMDKYQFETARRGPPQRSNFVYAISPMVVQVRVHVITLSTEIPIF